MFRDARHALITGAAGAVGSALAEVIAARAPGIRLSLVDKDEKRAGDFAARLGGRARALAWDLSKPSDLGAAWDEATRDGDEKVDVLVNCAGIMEMRTFAATPWSLGSLLLDVDLVSPMRLMSLAVPAMRESGRGLVVNVASMAGLVPLRGSAYYGAAKAGLAMASEIARLELARHGVHVLTVYPGPVTSELERRARAQMGSSWTARAIPTGKASDLAEKIARAAERRQPRVIYPSVYAGAAEVLSVARRFTERFSPAPLE